MRIKVIGTGSAGNCYALTDSEGNKLMLEAGMPIQQALQGIDFDTSRLVGVLVTHEHLDHAKFATQWAKRGTMVYGSKGTLEAIGGSDLSWKVNTTTISNNFLINNLNFQFTAFHVQHDAAEPVGYLIKHPENKILFITDAGACNIVTKGVDTMMVECNFDIDSLNASSIPESLKNRIYQAHFSLSACKQFLLRQDLSKCRNIIIIHCSKERSDTDRITAEIQKATGIPVTIARNGLTIDI